MTEKLVKEGFAQAEKEQHEKQVAEVKKIVLKTLEKKREYERIRDDAVSKIKILNMDLEDLKEGKLDRIVERQDKDEEAKRISVVVIIKEKEVHHYHDNPWYVPYRIVWNEPMPFIPLVHTPVFTNPAIYCSTTSNSGNDSVVSYSSAINCSTAKEASVGAYELSNSEIVHLR